VQLWWQQFLFFFPTNKCNFLHKNELQFRTGRRPVRSFSPGAVATIAVWKSVPMNVQMSCGVSRHSEASKKITPPTMYMLVTICCDCGKMPVFARFVVVQSGKVEYLVTRFVTLIIAYISIELFISFLPA